MPRGENGEADNAVEFIIKDVDIVPKIKRIDQIRSDASVGTPFENVLPPKSKTGAIRL